jgi:glyoxylase-like metal-dependent hydrolase (beta-lactamase superfamily II)
MYVTDDIIQIEIPLPFALKLVNCYLLRGPDGWALIDTGIGWPPARDAWHAALAQHDLRPRDIVAIVVTHNHPDHVGLAGWWQQQSDAPVLMTQREAAIARTVWSNGERSGGGMADHFARHGMPRAWAGSVIDSTVEIQRMVAPLPSITPLEIAAGESPVITIAGRSFEAIVLPGHSDGQLCLLESRTRTLICADQVLARITPNISVWPGTAPDPLRRYLASFALLESLDARIVLPGHGPAFSDLPRRLTELRDHHARRLDDMLRALQAMDGATAYEITRRVFPAAQTTPAQIRFALGETIAHLDYLVSDGRAERIDDDPIRYVAQA